MTFVELRGRAARERGAGRLIVHEDPVRSASSGWTPPTSARVRFDQLQAQLGAFFRASVRAGAHSMARFFSLPSSRARALVGAGHAGEPPPRLERWRHLLHDVLDKQDAAGPSMRRAELRAGALRSGGLRIEAGAVIDGSAR